MYIVYFVNSEETRLASVNVKEKLLNSYPLNFLHFYYDNKLDRIRRCPQRYCCPVEIFSAKVAFMTQI